MKKIKHPIRHRSPLSAQVTTRAGYTFSPADMIWQIPDQSGSLSFNFNTLEEYCSPEMVMHCKKIILIYLQKHSGRHANNMFERFKHYVRSISTIIGGPVTAITSASILNYRASLTKSDAWYLGAVAGLFKKWHAAGYPGVDNDVLRLLKDMKLPGNTKGAAVLTHDPLEGPFDENELTAALAAAGDAYAERVISTRKYLLVLLFAALGARPVQFASLKIKDFRVIRGSQGAIEYFLDVPRAKQRDSLARTELTPRILLAEIGEVLALWIERVKEKFHIEITQGFPAEDLPIFPTRSGRELEMNNGFRYHTRGTQLSDELVDIFKKIDITSPRTGEALVVTALRFRRTIGTRAAEEGHGELIIAQLLDHSDTQNARVYVQATPKILERIDKVLGHHLAPVAQAFQGKIITDLTELRSRGDHRAPIRSAFAPEKDAGLCGKHGFCSASAPVACYTCRNFQAWLDGPHEQVLKALLTERERVFSITGDARIAGANDRTILAVKGVIEKCNTLKAEGGNV